MNPDNVRHKAKEILKKGHIRATLAELNNPDITPTLEKLREQQGYN